MTHNEILIERFTTPATREAFAALSEQEYFQWLDAAFEELEASDKTTEDHNTYVGKVALVHHFWESNKQ